MNRKCENYSLARYARTFKKSAIFPGYFHNVRNKVMSSQNISPQNLMTITKENLENKIHLGVLSKEKKITVLFSWRIELQKGVFAKKIWEPQREKFDTSICYVLFMRPSSAFCFARFASTPSVGGFWQETFLHVNSKPEPKLRSGKVDVKLLSHKSSL